MSIDKRDAKRNRVLAILSKYEDLRKEALSSGGQFKPPSKEQLRREADVNKNYWSESAEDDIKKRVEELTDRSNYIKSKAEEKAEAIVDNNEKLQQMYDALVIKLEQMSVAQNQYKIEIKELRNALQRYEKIIADYQITEQKKSEANVTPFQTIKGGKDDE